MIERGINTDRTFDVLLGFVDNGNRAGVFMDSVFDMFAYELRSKQPRCKEYHQAGGPYIHDNKARVARYFLECTDMQWLWMCDPDMKFPGFTLHKLLSAAEKHDTKILGAAYWNTYGGDICLSWLALTKEHGMKAVAEMPKGRDPVEVSAVGMGCTLLHRDVVSDIADAFAMDPWSTFGADVWVRYTDGTALIGRTPDEILRELKRDPRWRKKELAEDPQRLGEDVTFCLRARRLGYITYGLPTLLAEHWKPQMVPHGGRAHELPLDRSMEHSNGGSELYRITPGPAAK